VYTQEFLNELRNSPWGETQRDQKEGLEFGYEEYKEIDIYCKSKNIEWFASAWDSESLVFLKEFNTKYNKVASAMITDLNLLELIAKEKKHTFISTGMTDFSHIDKAVDIFKKYECSYELMHCVSTYPMKPELANLKSIEGLKSRYDCSVGYSGHESGVAVSIVAVLFGISSLERHITLDRSMYGSDQSASLEPRGLRELVGSIEVAQKAIGEDKAGHFFEEEIPIAKKLRAHIVQKKIKN
jgi:N-acetylneuraminate synthase